MASNGTDSQITVFIAEKPSVMRDLAACLGVVRPNPEYIECQGKVFVTSCFGHMLEQAPPDYYDSRFKNWSLSDLPIVPLVWDLLPKANTKKRLETIGRLIHKAGCVVNAGDPDNEGQLLVDEVLDYFSYRGKTLRYWCGSPDPESMKAALQNLQDNAAFVGRKNAAIARSRADWLYGMNLTRYYTLMARRKDPSASGVFTVGRVQTPTLAMVANRDQAIANFRPIPFHHLDATFETDLHEAVTLRFSPPADFPGLDEEGRLVDTNSVNALGQSLVGQRGRVSRYEAKKREQNHPPGLTLSALGLLASENYGFSAAKTLQVAQKLYEVHKIATYPRTDGAHLPESQHANGRRVLAAIGLNMPALAPWLAKCDPTIRSSIWSDKHVAKANHPSIVPTTVGGYDMRKLDEDEINLYQLIVRQYIAQFLPVRQYTETELEITVQLEQQSHAFKGSVRQTIDPGWTALYPTKSRAQQTFPTLDVSQVMNLVWLERFDTKTEPPKPFTEGTLPVAMSDIHRYGDEADKQALKEGEGIGTEATRASIIEELKVRQFLCVRGKNIHITAQGMALLNHVDERFKSPTLTAQFQRALKQIEKDGALPGPFVEEQIGLVAGLIRQGTAALPPEVHYSCPACNAGQLRRLRSTWSKTGYFWGCSRYAQGCKYRADDNDGAPEPKTEAEPRSAWPSTPTSQPTA